MRISLYEQEQLADAIARAVRLQFRVLPLHFSVPISRQAEAEQHEVQSVVSQAIEQYLGVDAPPKEAASHMCCHIWTTTRKPRCTAACCSSGCCSGA